MGALQKSFGDFFREMQPKRFWIDSFTQELKTENRKSRLRFLFINSDSYDLLKIQLTFFSFQPVSKDLTVLTNAFLNFQIFPQQNTRYLILNFYLVNKVYKRSVREKLVEALKTARGKAKELIEKLLKLSKDKIEKIKDWLKQLKEAGSDISSGKQARLVTQTYFTKEKDD